MDGDRGLFSHGGAYGAGHYNHSAPYYPPQGYASAGQVSGGYAMVGGYPPHGAYPHSGGHLPHGAYPPAGYPVASHHGGHGLGYGGIVGAGAAALGAGLYGRHHHPHGSHNLVHGGGHYGHHGKFKHGKNYGGFGKHHGYKKWK